MPEKRFRIRGDQIRPLAEGCGGFLVTDVITTQGHKGGLPELVGGTRTPDSSRSYQSHPGAASGVATPWNSMPSDYRTRRCARGAKLPLAALPAKSNSPDLRNILGEAQGQA